MKITEIVDSKTDNVNTKKTLYPATAGSDVAQRPHIPSVKAMRESQAAGAEGLGTAEKSFAESMDDLNQ